MTIRERIEAAEKVIDSLPEWVKPNLLFHGGSIQNGHEALHKVEEQGQ